MLTKDDIFNELSHLAQYIGYFDILIITLEEMTYEARNDYLNDLEFKNFKSYDELYDYFIN